MTASNNYKKATIMLKLTNYPINAYMLNAKNNGGNISCSSPGSSSGKSSSTVVVVVSWW